MSGRALQNCPGEMSAVALFTTKLDDLAHAIETEHRAALAGFRATIDHAIRCGELLLQAKAGLPHGQWLPWINENLNLKPRQCQNYMRVAENREALNANLAAHLTIDQALTAIADRQPLRVHLTGAVEWYTPAPYLECARYVLGEFDLDPASSDIAQEQVRALDYFTKDDDSLEQHWNGRVWCNPPYCNADKFVDKLLDEIRAGRTTEAVLLVNAYCDTRWFHRALAACAAICFTLGRIKFEKPDGQPGQPPHGSAIFYFGPRLDRFSAAFADHGSIVLPARDEP